MKALNLSRGQLIITFVVAIFAVFAGYHLMIADSQKQSAIPGPSYILDPYNPLKPPVNPDRPVISRSTEYRPSTDPSQNDTYCVNKYGAGSFTYQYIGRTPVADPTLTCPS